MSASRLPFAQAALALGGILVGLALAEGLLRVAGVRPWTPFESFAQVPVMTEAHPELGWVNRPGRYRYPAGPGDAPTVEVTIGPDGARGAGPSPCEGEALWMMGGSFVYGFGVSDGGTLPAAIAEALPGRCVLNYGVPGYGTVQARGLYQVLVASQSPPQAVVYGLIEYHDARNVAADSWLAALDRAKGGNPWVTVPGVRWDGATLSEPLPRRYAHWERSESLVVAYLLERAYLAFTDMFTSSKTETTVQIVRRWRAEVEATGGRFVVALLFAPTAGPTYVRRLGEEGVEVIDLRQGGYPAPRFQVPGDGHPNEAAHRQWAAALAEALR